MIMALPTYYTCCIVFLGPLYSNKIKKRCSVRAFYDLLTFSQECIICMYLMQLTVCYIFDYNQISDKSLKQLG